jgi:hypothetical protein
VVESPALRRRVGLAWLFFRGTVSGFLLHGSHKSSEYLHSVMIAIGKASHYVGWWVCPQDILTKFWKTVLGET